MPHSCEMIHIHTGTLIHTGKHTQFPPPVVNNPLWHPILSQSGQAASSTLPPFLSLTLFRSGSLSVYSVHTKPSLTMLRLLNQVAYKFAVMSLFPDPPHCGWLARWGSAALRQLWWQSRAGGLCERRHQHHLFGKSRTTEDKKKEEEQSLWKAVVSLCLPTLALSHMHTHWHTLPSPLPSSLPVCLLHSPMLVWRTAGHSAKLHGGTGRGREPR